MNRYLHTLTAYHLTFSYLRRNNPLKEELQEKIKNNEIPKVDIEKLLDKFIELTKDKNYELLKNYKMVALLKRIEDVGNLEIGKRIFIMPSAGKTDLPFDLINLKNDEERSFDKNWVSTYQHIIFVYCINDEYYMICHRNGGSGCKTILSVILNRILKEKGIKMEMNFMPPNSNNPDMEYDIETISLICEEKKSSDISDNLTKKQKKVKTKELTLSLKYGNHNIQNLCKKYQIKEISREVLFDQIKKEINDDTYNTASVTIKIGKVKRKISWEELERLIGGFNITDKVANLSGEEFINMVKQCSDTFITQLMEG